jgi:hypothetical protein
VPEDPTTTVLGRSIGRRRKLQLLAVLAIVASLVIIARWPVTTAVGIDYRVTVKQLTLFEKAAAFVSRDLEMRRLMREIVGTGGTQEQRLLRMYDWVSDNVHPIPPGLPVVDDHVLYIFVRRYGAIDQRAEALAALASYDSMPATTLALGKDPKRQLVQLTVVQLADRLVVFDVNNGITFRKLSGELATIEDLRADVSIIRRAGAAIVIDGAPYHEHFQLLREMDPSFVRMEAQRFWPRLRNELIERLLGR